MKEYTWETVKDREIQQNATFETAKECIEDAKQCGIEDNKIFVGECVPYIVTIDAISVLEDLEEDAYDYSEIAESWNLTSYENRQEIEKLSDELTKVVNRWLEKNNLQPTFYTIQNVKEYEI